MANVYITKDIVTSLDNKALIEKSQDIDVKISKARVKGFPQNIFEDMLKIQKWIDEEIDARLDDGRMDEDELDEDF